MARVDGTAVAPDASAAALARSDDLVERVLRWAVIERGTAGLSDHLGADVISPRPPARFLPPSSAVAGKVVLLRRQRLVDGSSPPSSFDVIRSEVTPGSVVLVHCEPGIGATFGSNIALHAAACRAQALVTDGAWRDTTRVQCVGIPIGGNGTDPTRPAGCPMVASGGEDMFGLTWYPGDWFVRDADGVLRVDDEVARRTAAELVETGSDELTALLASAAEGR